MEDNKDEQAIIYTIAEGVRTIRDDILPDIKEDVKQARDTALSSAQEIEHMKDRITSLEDSPSHSCDKVEAIATLEANVESRRRMMRFLVPIMVSLSIILIGFLANNIRAEASMRGSIDTNAKAIKQLTEFQSNQTNHVDKVLKAVDKLPNKVEESFDNLTSKRETTIDEEFERRIMKLSTRDKRYLRRLWKTSEHI